MKYLSGDLEMCGLDAEKSSILEAGFVLEDTSKPLPLNQLPIFHCYFLPEDGDHYCGQPYALSMHPHIFRRIAERDPKYTYMHPRKFGYALKTFLLNNGFEAEKDRITVNVAGKNFGSCDYQVLLKQTDLEKHVKFRHRFLDPSILFLRPEDETVPGLQLCKERAGIEGEVSHNAIDDARDVIRLIRASGIFDPKKTQ